MGVDKSGKKGEDWMSLPETFKAAVCAAAPLCNRASFAQEAAAQGYTTTGLGKTFHPGSPKNWDQPKSWTPKYPYWDPDEQIASFHTIIPVDEQQYPAIEGASGKCVKKTGSGFVSHE